MPRLEFNVQHSYAAATDGVSLPVTLRSAIGKVELLAYVDTGASHCLFERECAKMLKLDLESGDPKMFGTAAGRVEIFGHLVEIAAYDLSFESVVYFFADEHINKNLLGRIGWLDRVRLGLVDHDRQIYLAPYDFVGA